MPSLEVLDVGPGRDLEAAYAQNKCTPACHRRGGTTSTPGCARSTTFTQRIRLDGHTECALGPTHGSSAVTLRDSASLLRVSVVWLRRFDT